MDKNKIIVTGGTGFIGSHTAVELISRGYEVMIADDLSNSRIEVIDAIYKITGTKPAFRKLNLCDVQESLKLFRDFKPNAVVHFAASKLVGESVQYPLKYYRNNLVSLMNVVEAGMESGCNHLVFSSSCTVYGQPEQLPVTEQAPLRRPESPYGNTKKLAEEILQDYSKVNPYHVVSLRYFNPVGAHKSALIGEYPLGAPSNLMPILTQTAIGKRKSFEVFGNDYNTPDGTCIRDYIHITDLATAHVAAIERLISGKSEQNFEVFNIGTGNGISVLEMIGQFEKENGVKLNYRITGRRPGDVEQVWADTQLAQSVLGWKATRGLSEMVTSAWAWEKRLAQMEKSITT
jgi:UDP-glucose 4-epimerase